MKSYDHKYKLLYKVERPEKPPTKDELVASKTDMSATDALFVCSLIYPPDGSLSSLFMSFDGRKKARKDGSPAELDDSEWFKVWGLLALRLADSKTLSEHQKGLCLTVHTVIRDAILSARARDEGQEH